MTSTKFAVDEIVSTVELGEDPVLDKKLRPSFFDEFIGQKQRVENLKTYVQGAKQRKEALDHVLLYGPPGLGKRPWPISLRRKSG